MRHFECIDSNGRDATTRPFESLWKIITGSPEADVDCRVGWVYLERGKKDWANREQWAQQAAVYFDKAAALASNDPFVLEQAMDGFNKVGDYSDKGCPDYEKDQRGF
jgi:hypothetical protein